MTSKPKPTLTVAELLADHSAKVRRIAARLRKLFHTTAPELEERIYPVWHAIGLRHPRAGFIAGIFPYDESCRIYFESGRALADPAGILRGEQLKQTRYVEISNPAHIPEQALADLLRAAIAHSLTRSRARTARSQRATKSAATSL